MTIPRAAPIDVLRRAVDAATPLAPVHAATHCRLREIEPGRCAASMPGVADDPDLGLWVLADFVVGLAVTGTVGPGERITTLRLTLETLAPPPPGALHAVGELVETGDGVALSRAVITDDDGRTVARAGGRNAVLRDAAGDTFDDTPAAFTAAPWSAAALLGVREDGDRVVARPDRAATNSADVVQGGVLAALATRALRERLGRRPDEVGATFVRAVPAGADVAVDVVVEHAGRRLRTGRAQLTDPRERLVLAASGLTYADTGGMSAATS